ncbi:Uncharacterised protein [Serratia fonticola]|uniref:Uncharacterized protein n=1 Tax=Serratia fonticola TaxID=47917 RepID=A0A4U9UNL5_SERFO|nr:Uncharacterised protein [Serratia fonticola]
MQINNNSAKHLTKLISQCESLINKPTTSQLKSMVSLVKKVDNEPGTIPLDKFKSIRANMEKVSGFTSSYSAKAQVKNDMLDKVYTCLTNKLSTEGKNEVRSQEKSLRKQTIDRMSVVIDKLNEKIDKAGERRIIELESDRNHLIFAGHLLIDANKRDNISMFSYKESANETAILERYDPTPQRRNGVSGPWESVILDQHAKSPLEKNDPTLQRRNAVQHSQGLTSNYSTN